MSKAIILVAFGSSNLKGIEGSIGLLERDLKEILGNQYTVITAFTSKKIIELLKVRHNFVVPHITKALFNLGNDGYDEVIIQPLHMMNGKSSLDLQELVDTYKYSFMKIKLGKPLLGYEGEELMKETYRMARALGSSFDESPVLLAGHGSKDKSNGVYDVFKKSLSDVTGRKFYMATIEGDKPIDDALESIKSDNVDSLIIKPLFIIPGKHVLSDIASGTDSWLDKLRVSGVDAKISNYSLLEHRTIRKIFIENIKEML